MPSLCVVEHNTNIGSHLKGSVIIEVGIEVKDHAGFGLRDYRDTVVCCLLGFR
jgi:hypothetical protein